FRLEIRKERTAATYGQYGKNDHSILYFCFQGHNSFNMVYLMNKYTDKESADWNMLSLTWRPASLMQMNPELEQEQDLLDVSPKLFTKK
uniref:hypothetical protein n=1 Tax=uncultured Akkermansia sp. TaxID=512294 RepID=UPI002608C6F2